MINMFHIIELASVCLMSQQPPRLWSIAFILSSCSLHLKYCVDLGISILFFWMQTFKSNIHLGWF